MSPEFSGEVSELNLKRESLTVRVHEAQAIEEYAFDVSTSRQDMVKRGHFVELGLTTHVGGVYAARENYALVLYNENRVLAFPDSDQSKQAEFARRFYPDFEAVLILGDGEIGRRELGEQKPAEEKKETINDTNQKSTSSNDDSKVVDNSNINNKPGE